MIRYFMPHVDTADDTWRSIRYVSCCSWRWIFRGGGCE